MMRSKATIALILIFSLFLSLFSGLPRAFLSAALSLGRSDGLSSPVAVQDERVFAESSAAYEKKEIVYVRLNSDGAAKDVQVINHFTVTKGGLLEDYGDYQKVERLVGEAALHQEGEKVSAQVSPGIWYYQGTPRSMDLPWTFHFESYLNGQPVTPDMAGQSGQFEQRFRVTPNPKGDANINQHFILQLSWTIDPKLIRVQEAPGATIAEAGQNQMLNWMILPGQDQTWTWKAEVEHLALDGPMISGLLLSLDPQAIDLKSSFGRQLSKLTELHQGIVQLESGSSQLSKAAGQVGQGLRTLAVEGKKLEAGASSFFEGLLQYLKGLEAFYGGVIQAGMGSSVLTAGAEKFGRGLNEAANGGGPLLEGSQKLRTGIWALYYGLNQGMGQYKEIFSEIDPKEIESLLEGIDIKESIEALEKLEALIQPFEEEDVPTDTEIQTLMGLLKGAIQGMPDGEQKEKLIQAAAKIEKILGTHAAQVEMLKEAKLKIGLLIKVLKQIQSIQEKVSLKDLLGMMQQMNILLDGVHQLALGFDQFHDGLTQFVMGICQLNQGFNSIDPKNPGLLKGIRELNQGLEQLYHSAEDQLEPANAKLIEAVDPIRAGLDQYLTGVLTLADRYAAFESGQASFSKGTQTFARETAFLATWQDPKTLEALLAKMGQKPYEARSFLNSKNQHTAVVQFVIRVEGLPEKTSEVSEETPKKEKKSLWDLFLDLFR